MKTIYILQFTLISCFFILLSCSNNESNHQTSKTQKKEIHKNNNTTILTKIGEPIIYTSENIEIHQKHQKLKNVKNAINVIISERKRNSTLKYEKEILELINKHRVQKGLKELKTLKYIKTQTLAHTKYMIKKNDLSHEKFNNRFNYLTKKIKARYMGENVAMGHTSAKMLVKSWLNNPGHRQNIEGNFSHFNISAQQNNEGIWFYTNIFILK